MNVSLASNFAGMAKSVLQAFSPAVTAAVSPAASTIPAGATHLASAEVLRGSGRQDQSTLGHNSLAERGIIIVSGKPGEKPTPPGGQNGIIIVSGKPQARSNSLDERGIIIVSGTPEAKSTSLAERGIIIVSGKPASDQSDSLDSVKAKVGRGTKDLDSQDKMGNFQIQTLMSDMNQAETLASSVMKKRHEMARAILSKI